MVAGYHKFLEGRGTVGLSNSGLQAVDVMNQYGKDGLFVGSHSRATMVVDNAMRILLKDPKNQRNKILSGTTMKMVGAAAHLSDANQRYKQLSDSDSSIRVEGYKGDIVHEIVGANPPTAEQNKFNKGQAQIAKEMFSSETSSVHNCLGLGQLRCIQDGYRDEGDLYMHREMTVDELEARERSKGK